MADTDQSDTGEAPTSGGILRAPGEAEAVALGPNIVRFLIGGDETGGRLSLTLFTIAPPPAPTAPAHRHLDADELIYVLEGALDCTIGGRSRRLTSGGAMYVPRGTLHGLANPGPEPTTILVILTPPGFEGYWRASSQLLADAGGPPDPAIMLALQRQFHMESGGQARQFQ